MHLKLYRRRLQMNCVVPCAAIATVCLLTQVFVFAGTTGTLEGRVLDLQHGSAVMGVNIILGTNLGNITDTDGYYQINNIRAGIYNIRFSIVGYRTTTVKGVTILPDIRNRFDVQIKQSPVKMEAVEIQAQRPLIQKDQAATAYSMGETTIDQLPVSTMQEVLAIQPSTTLEGNVRGGRTDEVIYLIDGLPAQDVVGGGVGTNLPKSSITGLTIYTGGFEAEYGNALSGVVNIVTKSGTRNHSFGVRLEKDNVLPDSWNTQHNRLTEGELTASGPIVGDKLTYFSSNTFTLNDTRWWQDFQHFFGSPISKEFDGFEKVEYTFASQTRLSLQGLYSLHTWYDYEFSWRYNLAGLPPAKRNSYRIAATFSDAPSQHTYYTLSLSRFFLLSHIGGDSPNDLLLQPYEYDFFLRYIISGSENCGQIRARQRRRSRENSPMKQLHRICSSSVSRSTATILRPTS
jgi:hypothetical protein